MMNEKVSNFVLFTIITLIGFLVGFVFSNKGILLSSNTNIIETPAPYNHIPEKDILVAQDKVIIKVTDPRWATFEDTGSMNPVFDTGANSIQIIPKQPKDIHVGDIVSYSSRYSDGAIIHRVVKVGEDNDGWFAELKGDNNFLRDPGKIRFNQIKSLTIAIVY